MKDKIKKIVSVLILVMLVVIGAKLLGYMVRPVDTDICISAIDKFHEMPENTFEVIGYGSSHMWRGVNPKDLYLEEGIGAYNYGCNWQNINTTLLFLKDSLKTQKPKVAIIETYLVGEYKENQNIDGEIYYTTAIEDSKDKKDYLKMCFGDDKERYLSYFMPLCAFHDNWTEINNVSFVPKTGWKYGFENTMGYVQLDNVMPITIKNKTEMEQLELDDTSIAVLDEIVNTCKENDIQLVFLTIPSQEEYNYSDAMKEYAYKNNIPLLDMYENTDIVGFDGEADYSDEGHLNYSGAKKLSSYLGKYLKENYDLTDYREVDDNIWQKTFE